MTHSTHFILWLYGIRCMVKNHWYDDRESLLLYNGYSFQKAARVLLHAPVWREDSTRHSLCYNRSIWQSIYVNNWSITEVSGTEAISTHTHTHTHIHMCMCVCVCGYDIWHLYLCVFGYDICTTHTHTYIYILTHTQTHYTYISLFLCENVCVCVCMYVCMYICMYICMCIHTHTYIHTHTHTYTHTYRHT